MESEFPVIKYRKNPIHTKDPKFYKDVIMYAIQSPTSKSEFHVYMPYKIAPSHNEPWMWPIERTSDSPTKH